MAQIISFKDLFEFSDSTPIDEAIKQIERLNQTLEGLKAIADKSAEGYSHALNDIAKSAAKLDDDMGSLDSTLKEHQDLIVKSAVAAEKLIASQAEAAKAMEGERIAAEKLKATSDALRLAKEKLDQANIKEAGSVAALKSELNKAVKEVENMGSATDAMVKKAALDRVSELAKQVNTADAALKQAKKGVDVAAGSYDALVQEVSKAKKELKAMEGGIGSNTAEFKTLQKTVKDGTDKLKEFDESVGTNTRSVGGYEQAIINVLGPLKAIPGVGGLATKALNLLSKTPVILTLTALGAVVGALTSYFKGSVEGQDNLNKVLAVGNIIFQTLLDVVESVGKVLFDTITKPKKAFQDLWDLLKPLRETIVGVFEDPIGAIKALGDIIVTNIINRFKAIGVAGEAIAKIFKGDILGGFKGLADAAIQGATGVTGATDKIIAGVTAVFEAASEAGKKLAAEAEARFKASQKLANLENQIRKDKIADTVDDANTELAVYKKLNEAQDKLRFSANERFAAQKAAGKLLQDQLVGDLELIRAQIDAQKQRAAIDGDTYEAREALAALQAEEIGLQSAYEKAFKKRQATERQLLEEAEKDRLAIIKRESDAQRQLNDIITKSHIDSNKDIIEDERTSLDDRIALINENAGHGLDLAKSNLEKELDAAKEAGIERVQIDADVLDAIYSQQGASAEQINAQRRAAAEAALATDSAYMDDVAKLNEVFKSETIRINDETVQATSDNVFKQWARDYQAMVDGIEGQAATEALGLNEAFAAGLISLKDFNEAREELQNEAQIRSLESQLKYLEQQAAALKAAGNNTTALDSQIAQTRLAISDAQNANLLEGERALQASLQELKKVAYETALTIIDSANEREDMEREAKLEKLTTQYETEIQMAGDNDAAKMALTTQFNIEKDKIEKEQRAADRKRAIFQKTLAVVEIAINTAKGIGMALGSFVPPVSFALAAVVGVIGALQIAAVLSKPIPAFAEGTDNAPGGWSLINEEGQEAVTDSRGTRIYKSKGPALVDLEKGAIVHTAEKTARMREALVAGDNMVAGFDDDTQKMRHIKVEVETASMTSILGGHLNKIHNVLVNQKPANLNPKGLAREINKGFNMSMFEDREYK